MDRCTPLAVLEVNKTSSGLSSLIVIKYHPICRIRGKLFNQGKLFRNPPFHHVKKLSERRRDRLLLYLSLLVGFTGSGRGCLRNECSSSRPHIHFIRLTSDRRNLLLHGTSAEHRCLRTSNRSSFNSGSVRALGSKPRRCRCAVPLHPCGGFRPSPPWG